MTASKVIRKLRRIDTLLSECMDEIEDAPLDAVFDEGSWLARIDDARKFIDYLIEDITERYDGE